MRDARDDRGEPTIIFSEVLQFRELNPSTTGNPFLGTKLLGFNIGRDSGALEGLRPFPRTDLRGKQEKKCFAPDEKS